MMPVNVRGTNTTIMILKHTSGLLFSSACLANKSKLRHEILDAKRWSGVSPTDLRTVTVAVSAGKCVHAEQSGGGFASHFHPGLIPGSRRDEANCLLGCGR